MSVFTSLAGLTNTLVTQFGTPVVLREMIAPKPRSGAAPTPIDHSVKAVIEDYTLSQIQGLLQAGDKKLIVGTKDLPAGGPQTGWKVVYGGKIGNVEFVRPIRQGGVDIQYELTVRGL